MTSLSNRATKRIYGEIMKLKKEPLTSHNIHVAFNEENIQKMYALIIGGENTSYEGGFYFFEFSFPNNYPINPPKVKFMTSDHNQPVRFNPNLYKTGKVCLSLLGTWSGPGWTPCNTVASILLSIKSMILVNEALRNEPGYKDTSKQNAKDYDDLLKHENYRVAILKMLYKMPDPLELYFREIINKYFIDNFKMYHSNVIKYNEEFKNKYTFTNSFFSMKFNNIFPQMVIEICEKYEELSNNKIDSGKELKVIYHSDSLKYQ